MKFATVCSGIGAPEIGWIPLDWKPQFFSEIEPFPSAVLAHHYPDVPNLGDMTKFKEWGKYDVDVICAGCPCQSFSVAGLRKGLEDPRGNLTLTYLAILDKYKPKYMVYENVPGLLSDKTNAFTQFLDGLEELGYVCDVDILDAQFFGVPQRRRRIFVVGHHIDDILKTKTLASAQVIAQMLMEVCVLNFVGRETGSFSGDTTFLNKGADARDLISRRLKLFKVGVADTDIIDTLANNFVESKGGYNKDLSTTYQQLTNIICNSEQVSLDELLIYLKIVSKDCPKKSENGSISDETAYALARFFLILAKYLVKTNKQLPTYASAATMAINGLMEFTDYARQANCNILADMEWLSLWDNFIGQANELYKAFGYFGDTEDRSEILSFCESLSGNNPQSTEEGEDPASDATNSPSASSRDNDGCGKPDGCGTDGRDCGAGIETFPKEVSHTITSRCGIIRTDVTDGTDSTVAVINTPISMINMQGSKGNAVAQEDGPSFTLSAMHGHDVHAIVVPKLYAPDVANTITSRDSKGVKANIECSTVIVQESSAKTINIYGAGPRKDRPNGGFYVKEEDFAQTLMAGNQGSNPTAHQGGTVILETPKWWDGKEIAASLTANSYDQMMPDKGNFGAVLVPNNKPATVIPINTHNNMRDPEKFDAINRQGMGIGNDGDPSPTISCAHVPAVAYDMRGNGDGNTIPCLTGDHASRPTDYTPVIVSPAEPQPSIAIQLSHTAAKGPNYREETAYTLEATTSAQAVAFEPGFVKREGSHIYNEISGTLRATAGDNQMAVATGSIDVYNLTQEQKDIANTVTAATGICNATGPKVLATPSDTQAYDLLGTPASNIANEVDVHTPLRARIPGQMENSTVTVVSQAMQVRRLSERECEKLQGFPVDFTRIPYKGKSAEDCPSGPRYKACGNSMATPCLTFIGERIMAIEESK